MGIFWHFEIGEDYDKNTIHLPRQEFLFLPKFPYFMRFFSR